MESSRKFTGFSFVFLFCVVVLYKPVSGQDFLRPLYVRADEFGTDYFKPAEAKVGPTKSRFHVESLLRLESELVGLSELILNTERKIHAKEALKGDNHTHKYDDEFKFLEEMRDISDAQTAKSEEMIANPLAMFPVRKRLSVEWPDIMKNITSCSMVSDYASIEEHFETIQEHLLADADLTSAFEDLLRIQKTYKIPVSSLARGWLYTAKSDPLSLTDIITIAHHCLEKEDMEGAVEWLLQVAKFVKSSKLQSGEKAIYLNILGGAYLRLNKLQESKMVYTQILKDDPTSKIAQANLKLIEEKIKVQAKASSQKNKQKVEKKGKRRRKNVEEDDEEKKDNNIYEQWWMRYCRGDYPKNQVEESKLMCYVRHFKHGNQSYNVEVLNRYPPMVLVHDFIGNFTAWKMMERAENELKDRIQRYSQEEEASSVIQVGGDTPWLDSFVHKLRNVTYPFLTDTYEYVLMDNFRIYNVAAGGTSNPLRGEHYIGPKNTGYERFLMGRAFFILKEPQVGGSVVFPYLKVDMQPKKGDALFYQFRTPKSYSHSNLGLRFECPVALGEMWYAEQAIEHHGMIDYIPFMFQESSPGDVLKAVNNTAADEEADAEAATAGSAEEEDEKEVPVKKTTKTKSTSTPSTKSSSPTKKSDPAKKPSTEKKSTGTGKTTGTKSTKKTVKK